MMVSLLILILIRETLCPAFSPSIQNHHCRRLDWVKVLRKVSFLEHALIESLNVYTLLNRRKYVVVVGGPVGTMDDVPLLSLGNCNYFYFGNLIESFYTWCTVLVVHIGNNGSRIYDSCKMLIRTTSHVQIPKTTIAHCLAFYSTQTLVAPTHRQQQGMIGMPQPTALAPLSNNPISIFYSVPVHTPPGLLASGLPTDFARGS